MLRKSLTTILAVAVVFMFSVPAMADSNANAGALSGSQSGALIDQSGSTYEAMDRGFNIPGEVKYGPVINYYGKPLPTAQFRPVESLLLYGSVFSEGALEEVLAGYEDIIHELEIVRGKNQQVRAKYEDGEVRWIKIIASSKKLDGHGIIGYVTAEADNRKTSMMEVVAQAALDALQEGADVLQIVAQGASRDTETSGWGIGFNTTQATISGSAGSANASSGGMGYSKAWAGMRDKPWLQANALKAPTKIVGELLQKPVKTAEVKAAPKKAEKKVAKSAFVPSTGNIAGQ